MAMDDTLPPSFMCPIGHDVMRDPYVCGCPPLDGLPVPDSCTPQYPSAAVGMNAV
eukprot:COSAG02_NODE_176_length_31159_cov_30.469833_12_plen_55_part_00